MKAQMFSRVAACVLLASAVSMSCAGGSSSDHNGSGGTTAAGSGGTTTEGTGGTTATATGGTTTIGTGGISGTGTGGRTTTGTGGQTSTGTGGVATGGAGGRGGQNATGGVAGGAGVTGGAGMTGAGGAAGAAPAAMEFYVSPSGADTNPGTMAAPFKTVGRAQTAVRGSNGNMTGDIRVYLRAGTYQLTAPLTFDSRDSGSNGHYVVYQAYGTEVASISGGKAVTGWTQVSGKPYYVASVPVSGGYADYFRQLYVNGVRAYRASSAWITGSSFYNDPATSNASDGVVFAAGKLKAYTNVTDLRVLHVNSFKVDEWPVVAVSATTGGTAVELQQPYFTDRINRGGGYLNATDKFMIVNAFEELDKPGEWYHDRTAGKLYYYPNAGEDLTTAEVIAPALAADYLVSIDGGAVATPVKNIRFQNLIFEHGNWLLPGSTFIGGSQAEALLPANSWAAYSSQVPGDITLSHTSGIQFIGNTVRHMGGCGIHLYNDAANTLIQGNLFHDTTAAGVAVGRFAGAYLDDITGAALIHDNTISDNVVRDVGRDYMQATCISLMAALTTTVAHNDVADCAYMGIHSRMQAKGNYTTHDTDTTANIGQSNIDSNLVGQAAWASIYGIGDNGSIYNHGPAKNSTIQKNYVLAGSTNNGFYNDDNTYETTFSQNVNTKGWNMSPRSADPKTIIFSNDFGTAGAPSSSDCVVTNYTQLSGTVVSSWPQAAQTIANAAGLESAYKSLLTQVPTIPAYDYLNK